MMGKSSESLLLTTLIKTKLPKNTSSRISLTLPSDIAISIFVVATKPWTNHE